MEQAFGEHHPSVSQLGPSGRISRSFSWKLCSTYQRRAGTEQTPGARTALLALRQPRHGRCGEHAPKDPEQTFTRVPEGAAAGLRARMSEVIGSPPGKLRLCCVSYNWFPSQPCLLINDTRSSGQKSHAGGSNMALTTPVLFDLILKVTLVSRT